MQHSQRHHTSTRSCPAVVQQSAFSNNQAEEEAAAAVDRMEAMIDETLAELEGQQGVGVFCVCKSTCACRPQCAVAARHTECACACYEAFWSNVKREKRPGTLLSSPNSRIPSTDIHLSSPRCSSSRSSRARGAPLQPGVHPRQPPGSPPSRHQPRLSLDRGHLGRFSCGTVGAFAASGPSDTFEVHQVSQQGLEVFVRPQEGQEVKGSSGGAVYIHEGERGVDMIVGV